MSGGRIGAELGREQRLGLSFNDFIELTRVLPGAEFLDAADVLWGLRMVKSEAEIACMRRAGEITSLAFKKCFSRVRAGMTDKEAAKILFDTAVTAGGSQVWVLSNSGPYNYAVGFCLDPVIMSWNRGICSGWTADAVSTDMLRIFPGWRPSANLRTSRK